MIIATYPDLDMPLADAQRFAASTGQILQTNGRTVVFAGFLLSGFTRIQGGGDVQRTGQPTREAAR
jgi:hypothetical protein